MMCDPDILDEVCEKCEKNLSECICIDSIDWDRILLEVIERICPYCNGTDISLYERDGGSCPHCFNGKVDY